MTANQEPPKLLSLQEIKRLKKPLKEYYKDKELTLTSIEKAGYFIGKKVGSGGFFILIFLWTASWLTWNTIGPYELRFDPAPAFVLWLFISNMIQLFLLPLILISQNIEDKQFEKRAEADLQINIIAEREVENILRHLEHQNELIIKILERLEKKEDEDNKKS